MRSEHKKQRIIDCHCHLDRQDIADDFWKKNVTHAISIEILKELNGSGEEFWQVSRDRRIFILKAIHAANDISEELKLTEEKLREYPQIVGFKIYLGYQPVFANDPKLFPVYEFARENNLSVCFHCGEFAQVLSEGKSVDYATEKEIAEISKQYSGVNFIISHLAYPRFEETIEAILENKNCYTDFSGMFEVPGGRKSGVPVNKEDFNFLVGKLKELKRNYPQMHEKIMFGTDFFGDNSYLPFVNEYMDAAKEVFNEQELAGVLFGNALKAYPKIKRCLDLALL